MNHENAHQDHTKPDLAVRAHVRAGIAGIVLFGVLPLLSHRLVHRKLTQQFRGQFRVFGILLGLASGSIAYYSVLEFIRRGRGTPFVGEPPQDLVTSGPYRYTRNPQYVGNLGVMLGQALTFNSLGILLYAFVTWFLAELFLVKWEEPHLTRQFGEAYVDYKRTVPRWVGRPAQRNTASGPASRSHEQTAAGT
ncbi:MAG: isoprenylcysteine carboxylmethyltransferase family protein [Dehalococcoidia bacterium]